MKNLLLLTPLVLATGAFAQDAGEPANSGAAQAPADPFQEAAASVQKQLRESLDELAAVRKQIADEQLPLSRQLSSLESDLMDVRREYQETSRLLDTRTLNLTNLRSEIEKRQDEVIYLSNLLSEYLRNFESRLHIAEVKRYEETIEEARLAPENSNLSDREKFAIQTALVELSLGRLEEALGGTTFQGRAVDSEGRVQAGTYLMLGPAALFRSADGQKVGTAMERVGSLEPTVVPFVELADEEAAARLVDRGKGTFPLDPTLGDAFKVAATQETLLEHIQKGGAVMIPIFVMAGAALLVALYKWLGMLFLGKPSRKRIDALLDAVAEGDEEGAQRRAREIRGPVGRMLQAGAANLREQRELVEEILYESLLRTKYKLNGLLPFIAICAASAPLLGLLGTVTGIINTFKMIEIFGSGDVKSLSGGISEALITTKFGLIVAIPSLLLHAYLSRKARGVIGQMEAAAVAFVNQLAKTPFTREHVVTPGSGAAAAGAPDPGLVRAQVSEILGELLGPLVEEGSGAAARR